MPTDGPDRTALWLTVIETLLREPRSARVPTVEEVVRLLTNVQFALKRWEVKIARPPMDFAVFERMVAFIDADCDRAQPERYAGLVAALTRRERVAAVVIVWRPGMIPDRGARL